MNFISTSGTLCCHVALLLIITFFFLMIRRPPRSTLFPTRRSSDLGARTNASMRKLRSYETEIFAEKQERWHRRRQDRKSTRLNSSHVAISYAVFCLKKKKKHRHRGCEQSITVTCAEKLRVTTLNYL